MRIAHATDIHWTLPPPVTRLASKRALGAMNLYFGGRLLEFPNEMQRRLVAHLIALAPDLVVLTGDLTATALEEEFALARNDLAPLLDHVPTFVIPGNHDVYTIGARRSRRIWSTFGPWMALDGPWAPLARLDAGALTVLGLDPNRPGVLSSGWVPEAQLEKLAEALADPTLGRFVLLALHYPILDRHGRIYDNLNHGLRNARALIDVLRHAPRRPDAIVHGHEHHGFRVELDLGDMKIPIFNSGSSGYGYDPARRRAACMNVYEVEDGRLVGVERHVFDGERFAPEPGGAYASRR